MISLILTTLYLAKDTVHRWLTRISSPLARVLVVYFLSLCAFAALGSYAISTKIVHDRIMRQGGDMVFLSFQGEKGYQAGLPTEKEISTLLDCDSYAIKLLAYGRNEKGHHIPIVTYDFRRAGQFMPLLAPSGGPTYLSSGTEDDPLPGPSHITFNREKHDVFVRKLPAEHPLMRLLNGRCVLVQPDNLPPSLEEDSFGTLQLIVKIRDFKDSASIQRIEQYFRNLIRLDKWNGHIVSAAGLLKELDEMVEKQLQCRIAFCIGISGIVGILLTALAGMEYRQNEYIYTLMKSFGIHPVMLVGSFMVENVIIVGASFAGALYTFMYFQDMIVSDILKLGRYHLSLEEILPEIKLISITLGGCILVSCLPIIAAANRAIGRVLK